MRNALLVAFGGAVGSVLRHLVSTLASASSASRLPLGTLVVNVVGCLAIGLFMGLAQSREWLLGSTRLLVVTGVLGGFTTFSAFAWETVALGQARAAGLAAANVLLQLALGLGAAWAGARLAASLAA